MFINNWKGMLTCLGVSLKIYSTFTYNVIIRPQLNANPSFLFYSPLLTSHGHFSVKFLMSHFHFWVSLQIETQFTKGALWNFYHYKNYPIFFLSWFTFSVMNFILLTYCKKIFIEMYPCALTGQKGILS